MPKIDLAYAIGLPPEKAIEYFKSKGYKLTWDWDELWQEAHAKAFTVAKVIKMDILQDIREMVQKSLDEGITFQQFKKELEPKLRAKGWWGYKFVSYPDGRTEKILEGSPRRLKTIFKTNVQTAYMAGRYKALMENVDSRPYWQYVAVLDNRTRPAHAALHGKVFRYDDPFWNTHYPPLGFNCRCRVRALSPKEVEKMGVKIEKSKGRITWEDKLISKKTGELRPVAVYHDPITKQKIPTDVGWSYNPGREAWEPDLDKYNKEIKTQHLKEQKLYHLIQQKEEEIKNLPYEKAYVLNRQGKVVAEQGGNKNSVVFSNDQLAQMKNCILTHNHPQVTSFSEIDIRFACYYQLHEIRITSPKYNYIMKPPSGGWSKEYWDKTISPLLMKIETEVRQEFADKIAKKQLTIEEANLIFWHEIWSRIAPILNLVYYRL